MWLCVAVAVVVALVNRKALLDRGTAAVGGLAPGHRGTDGTGGSRRDIGGTGRGLHG
jgi:hypothetical protein